MRQKLKKTIREFLALEASGGIILVAAALFAMVVSNSPVKGWYFDLLHTVVPVGVGSFSLSLSIEHWINDLLMAIFFLVVGMEIKREVIQGELSDRARAMLPLVGAFGGMAVPALIYLVCNYSDPVTRIGWAIPCATDIAFALGVLSLFGKRVPLSLKIFLTALAIVDDLGAILIIAFFYTAQVSLLALAGAALVIGLLVVLNRAGIIRLAPYLILGFVLWGCVYCSGVHATLAGVMLALCIPMGNREESACPLSKLMHSLHPWVAFAILPLFSFANSGIDLGSLSLTQLGSPVVIGVILGLFVGKQLGVFLLCWLAVRLGYASPPEGASWSQFYGVCVLTGIGFTMSLFIGMLAFGAAQEMSLVRLGVIIASIVSALVGGLVVYLNSPGSADLQENDADKP